MNNTTVPATVGWMPMSGGRGTSELLWSCGLTIFLCTWSVVHLNVPPDHEPIWRFALRRIKWMALNIIIPEYTATMAMTEWWDASFLRREVQGQYGDKLDKPFTMTQAYFAVMGGYALQLKGSETLLRLDGLQYHTLLHYGLIDAQSALLPTDEILDRSKGDSLTKAVTCLQICWLVVQLCGRVKQRLPITTLEIVTLAMVVCAIAAYAFWWHKPLSIRFPKVITSPLTEHQYEKIITHYISNPRDNTAGIDLNSVRFRLWNVNPPDWHFCLAAVALTVTNKSIHLLAWDFSFPTPIEQTLWRVAVLSCAVLAFIQIPAYFFRANSRWDQGSWRDPLWLMVTFYMICRAFVLVEVFYGLRAAQVGIYDSVLWGEFL